MINERTLEARALSFLVQAENFIHKLYAMMKLPTFYTKNNKTVDTSTKNEDLPDLVDELNDVA